MTQRLEQLKKLLAAEPDDPFCLYSLAFEYAKAGDPEQAQRYFDDTIRADPDYFYAYFHKARLLEQAGDVAGARELLTTGRARAAEAGDAKALSEIDEFLAQLP